MTPTGDSAFLSGCLEEMEPEGGLGSVCGGESKQMRHPGTSLEVDHKDLAIHGLLWSPDLLRTFPL